MTFLMPSYLMGLAAAAIPIIIHLISLRQTRVMEFSTLRFIQELEHETIRKLRLRQWLLVFLRTLIIVALVLAFARPVQEGFIPGWMAGEQETRVVIFIDNSASMALETEAGTLLERARRSIPQIARAFEGRTTLEIYQTNPPRQVFRGIPGEPSLRTAIATVTPTVSRGYLWAVVDSVLSGLEVSEPNRECFILSDFQSVPGEDFLDKLASDTTQPSWRFYCLGQPPLEDNLSIRDVRVTSQIRLPDQLLAIATRITNDGDAPKRNVPVELYLNDERVGQVVANFQPHQSKEFMFQAFPGKSGIVSGFLEIPDDDFDPDNRWTFEIPIPEQVATLVVGGSPEELYLLEQALRAISGSSELLLLETKVIPDPQRLYLDETDVLVLHNPGRLSDRAIEDIQAFLERGGGLIWFAGDRQLVNPNPRMETALRLPHAKGLRSLTGGSYLAVEIVGENRPSLLGDLNLRNLDEQLPQVFRHLQVQPRNRQEIVLKLNNGDPFLLNCPSNGGRIFYFTSLLDLTWNDLPMRGLLVPMLHRILVLLATDETNTAPVLVDDPKVITIDRETINREWSVVTPSGNTVLVIPDFNTESLVFTQTTELGSYEVLADGVPYAAFSTRLAPQEYPALRLDRQAVLNALPEGQGRWIEPDQDLVQKIKEMRYGKSLWRSFLMAALVLLMVESLLGRTRPEAVRG
jgi:hypothetical protein